MSTLIWDEVGERRFETGVDRGVLFPRDSAGVPWNGLVSVTENLAREVKSYYTDGVKYLDHQVIDAFSGTLQAYTYPDELDALTGVPAFAPGVFIHDQRSKAFSLSYRTKVGNDVDGIDHGYKLHLLYNVLATPSNAQFKSLSQEMDPQLFEWALHAVPPLALGIRPTSHISLHTRSLDPELLQIIEDLLYGTPGDPLADPVIPPLAPAMPPLVELLDLVEEFYA